VRYLPEPKAECVDMLSTYLSSNRPRYRDLPASECGHMAQAEATSLWLTLISCPFVCRRLDCLLFRQKVSWHINHAYSYRFRTLFINKNLPPT